MSNRYQCLGPSLSLSAIVVAFNGCLIASAFRGSAEATFTAAVWFSHRGAGGRRERMQEIMSQHGSMFPPPVESGFSQRQKDRERYG